MVHFVDAMRELRAILGRQDVRGAVIFLNSLTEHRFTALYRFDKETLNNLYFFDRENPAEESTPDIPISASYCSFVRSSGGTFSTPDSLLDTRVRGHQKRELVRSYCGVPMMDEGGRMFGTICHFDFEALPISEANIELMETVGPLLYKAHSASS